MTSIKFILIIVPYHKQMVSFCLLFLLRFSFFQRLLFTFSIKVHIFVLYLKHWNHSIEVELYVQHFSFSLYLNARAD
jgi:hypothetical protein